MSLRLKPGVRLANLQPQILLALQVAEGVYAEEGVDCWVTSVNDGSHGYGSLHFSGNAVDLRVHNLPDDETARRVATEIKERLAQGVEFDVVAEGLGTVNAHIHIEYQPKS